MPWEVQGGANVIVPAGTLDEEIDLKPQQNIFWDSRAEWYVETCEMKKFASFPTRKKPAGKEGE